MSQGIDLEKVEDESQEAEAGQVQTVRGIDWFSVMLAMSGTLFLMLMSLLIYLAFFKSNIYKVDINAILATHIQNIASMNLSESENERRSMDFAKALDAAVLELADGRHVVVPKAAVITGGEDMTAELTDLIAEKLD